RQPLDGGVFVTALAARRARQAVVGAGFLGKTVLERVSRGDGVGFFSQRFGLVGLPGEGFEHDGWITLAGQLEEVTQGSLVGARRRELRRGREDRRRRFQLLGYTV